jgi:hypothetical protein
MTKSSSGIGNFPPLVSRQKKIVIIVSTNLNSKCVEIHEVPSDDPGQELVVGDVLHDSCHDPTAFLVQDLIGPVRINSL